MINENSELSGEILVPIDLLNLVLSTIFMKIYL